MSKFRLRIASVRKAVFERDRGICALCGLDAEALRRELTDLPVNERQAREKTLRWPKHRLDFWDADHITPVAENGHPAMDNLRTLCLTCHRKVTASFMASRPHRVVARSAVSQRTTPAGRLLPGEDGSWWMATGSQIIDCPRCGRETQDWPAVMRYRAELDVDGIRGRHDRAWARKGWIVWRQCEHCSWMDFREETVTIKEIRDWDIGPWAETT